MKFGGWHWKTIGHLLHSTSSFVRHFVAIQTEVTVRKCQTLVKIHDFFVQCDLEIKWMTLNNNRAPFRCYSKLCESFNSYRSIQTRVTVRKLPNFGLISVKFCPVRPWNLWMTFKNNRAPLLYYFKLCASFHRHRSIQPGVTVQKLQIWVKICDFLCEFEIWRMTMKNNRAPFLCYPKLCASFRSHLQIQTGDEVQKLPIRIKIVFFCPVRT